MSLATSPFALNLAQQVHLFLLRFVKEIEPGLQRFRINIEAFSQVSPIVFVEERGILAQVRRDQFVAQLLVMRHPAQTPADDSLEVP